MTRLPRLFGVLLVVFLGAAAHASPPAAINYQGRLTDPDGFPLPDSTWSVQFVIYRDSLSVAPGDILWESGPITVDTKIGLFSVRLGTPPMAPLPDSLFADSLAWLGVAVDGEAELTPRSRIVSTPYALNAGTAERLSVDRYVDKTGDTIGGSLAVTGALSTGTDQIEAPVTFRSNDNWRWDVGNGYGDVRLSDGTAGLGIGLASTGVGAGTVRFWSSGGFVENLFFGSPTFGDIFEIYGTGQTIMRGTTDWLDSTNAGSRVRIAPDSSTVSVIGDDGLNKVDLFGYNSSGALRVRNSSGIASATIDGGDEMGGEAALYRSDGLLAVYLRGGAAATSEGGSIDLWDGSGGPLPSISLYPGATGDATVVVPDNAINSVEMEDESGVASVINTNQVVLGQTMSDLVVISVTIPAHGYIVLIANGQFENSGTTSINDLVVQIDETAGGSAMAGQYVQFGLGGYPNTGANYFPLSVQRIYFKPVGTYTFRFEGSSFSSGGSASCNSAKITALYFPTSYGPVATSETTPSEGTDPRLISIIGGDRTPPQETTYEVDLKALEQRAREARKAAIEAEQARQQAERDLAEAKRRQTELR